jgi:hypothetical protein
MRAASRRNSITEFKSLNEEKTHTHTRKKKSQQTTKNKPTKKNRNKKCSEREEGWRSEQLKAQPRARLPLTALCALTLSPQRE